MRGECRRTGESRAKRNMRQEKRSGMYGWKRGRRNKQRETMQSGGSRSPLSSSHGFFHFCEKILVRPIPRTVHVGFVGHEIWLLQYPIFFIHASRRSQFAPVIVSQIEFGLPPHSFSWKFSPASAARKISTKRLQEMRLARQIRFSFDEGGNCICPT